jgi:hypothetical protein
MSTDNKQATATTKGPASVIEAILRVRRKVQTLGKDKTNEFQNYKFVSIDTFYEKVKPLADAEGLLWRPHIIEWALSLEIGKHGSVQARVQFDLYLVAEDGSVQSFENYMAVPILNGLAGAQTTGQVMSYAEKVFMRHAFDVPTGESDGDDTDQSVFARENKGVQGQGRPIGQAGQSFPTDDGRTPNAPQAAAVTPDPVRATVTTGQDGSVPVGQPGAAKDPLAGKDNKEGFPLIDTRQITDKSLSAIKLIFQTWIDKPTSKKSLRNWYAENVPAIEKVGEYDATTKADIMKLFSDQAQKLPE